MLAMGAAEDCMGAAAVPLDVLEYRRCTRPYFATCHRAVDEEACLKQGKTRLTFIRIIVYLSSSICCRRPHLLQGVLPRRLSTASNFRAFPEC
jgi:hypothetical protein